jgi:hypothetical protein
MRYTLRFLFLLALLYLPSCLHAQGILVADRVNAPMLGKAGTLKLGLYIKPQDITVSHVGFSPSADASFSPLQNFAILLSWRSILDRTGFHENSKYNGNRFDLALGYYAKRRLLRLEVFGGYGNGTLRESDIRLWYNTGSISHMYRSEYRLSYHHVFLQGAAGLYINHFSVALGMRLSTEFYYHTQYTDTNVVRYILSYTSGTASPKPFFYSEPYLDLQYGSRVFKANMQGGFMHYISNALDPEGEDFYFLSLGVNVYIRNLFTKGKEQARDD